MKVAVLIKRIYQEDTIKCFFLNCLRPPRTTILAKALLYVSTPDSYRGCPFKRGQMIKISQNCRSVELNKCTDITYNAPSEQWEIFLPTYYVSDPIEYSKLDGFTEYSFLK